MSQNDRKKVVNTEEQNLPVNPGDRADEETIPTQDEKVGADQSKPQENPEKGSENDQPQRFEGEDSAGIDRKVPKL